MMELLKSPRILDAIARGRPIIAAFGSHVETQPIKVLGAGPSV
jgi:hypothetical protein